MRSAADASKPSFTTLSGLLLAQFLVGMTGTLVVTSLPRIGESLDMSLTESTWLVTVTILANSATTSLWAKIGDRAHRARILQLALIVFVAGTLGAAVAPGTSVLFVARAVQGIGIGGITVLATAIVAQLVPPRERARANAWLINTQMTAMFLGPLLGGAISQSPLGWRAAFACQLPLALLAMFLIHRSLRGIPVVAGASRGRLNLVATVAVPAGVASLLLALSLWSEGADAVVTALWLGAGVALITTAIITELRTANPVIPLRLLADRAVRHAVVASFAVGLTLFSSSVYASQYAQAELGFSPLQVGVLLTASALGMAIASVLGARYLDATGRAQRVAVVGLIMLGIGFALLAAMAVVPVASIIAGMLLIGAGTATVIPNLILIVHNTVPQRITSSAGGLVIFGQTLGGASGIALSSMFVAEIARTWTPTADTDVVAIPALYVGYAALAVVALCFVMLIPPRPLRETVDVLEPLPS